MSASNDFPYLAAKDVVVRYPIASIFQQGRDGAGYDALKGVSFELKPGARLGLIGRNGSGKSTLLRTLAGVFPPSSGEVVVRGERASVFSKTSGFVPNATGYENIFLRGTMLGLNFKQIEAKLDEIIAFSELGEWIHQPLYRYSSGMTLRLAFSITTCVEADILLLDEWLGAGDVDFVEKARLRMLELVENAGILVLATHNLNLMRGICDQALVLNEGVATYYDDINEAVRFYNKDRKSQIEAARTNLAQAETLNTL